MVYLLLDSILCTLYLLAYTIFITYEIGIIILSTLQVRKWNVELIHHRPKVKVKKGGYVKVWVETGQSVTRFNAYDNVMHCLNMETPRISRNNKTSLYSIATALSRFSSFYSYYVDIYMCMFISLASWLKKENSVLEGFHIFLCSDI